ncbi:hypothetical protein MASR2M15_25650 [Anaerolineales bacterium]
MTEQLANPILENKLSAIVRLTRWREHVSFTVPLTVVGAMMAVSATNTQADWRIIAVTIANILAVSFAFIINDVEDAPDDALDPKKRMHNVISSEVISHKEGMLLSWGTALLSFLLYLLCGPWTLAFGLVTLILSYLYSAHPFRFKARPITDVVSHVLMLSGLLVMTGYFVYDHVPNEAWLIIISAILFSAYGQFFNQVDDYEVDKKAGLKNTVVLIGKTPTTILMYACLLGAIVCMLAGIAVGIFPDWLGSVLIVALISVLIFPWEFDMRGNKAEGSGIIQRPSLLVANIVSLMWLVANIGWLPIIR